MRSMTGIKISKVKRMPRWIHPPLGIVFIISRHVEAVIMMTCHKFPEEDVSDIEKSSSPNQQGI